MRRRLSYLLALCGLFPFGPLSVAIADEGEDDPPRALLPNATSVRAAGPFEVRIKFDRPADPSAIKAALAGRSIIFDESRPNLGARPTEADADSRGTLRITNSRLEDKGRTLVLTTDPHPRAGVYTLQLVGGPRIWKVQYDLTGVEVSWSPPGDDARPVWRGRWANFEPAPRDPRPPADQAGKLSLETLVTLPKGGQTLTIASPAAVDATLNGEAPDGEAPVFRTDSSGDLMLLTLSLPTPKGGPLPSVRVSSRGSSGPEAPIPADRLALPWTPPSPPPPAPLDNVPDLAGGDPRKGAAVFASADAKCASCHKVRGEGGAVGPDLSGLVGRNRRQVYRDIAEPSARIHPDYVPYTVALKDGRVLVGTVRSEGADAIRLADTEAKVTVVPRHQIEDLRPSATSVMPVGLAGVLGEEKLRDLIAFLTQPPPK